MKYQTLFRRCSREIVPPQGDARAPSKFKYLVCSRSSKPLSLRKAQLPSIPALRRFFGMKGIGLIHFPEAPASASKTKETQPMRQQSRTATAAAIRLFAIGASLVFLAAPARATYHEWKIDEIYSNASATVQFVEFLLPQTITDDERYVGGQTLTDSALTHTFFFPSNLSSMPTANRHFLVATPGYATLTGVPA